MSNLTQKKWQSPVVWTSIASQIASLLILSGAIDIAQAEIINLSVGIVLQVLVIVGIFNNPNDAKDW